MHECLNCGHKQEVKKVYNDIDGDFAVCVSCEGSFDVDVEQK